MNYLLPVSEIAMKFRLFSFIKSLTNLFFFVFELITIPKDSFHPYYLNVDFLFSRVIFIIG
jgi:hypothetical protein